MSKTWKRHVLFGLFGVVVGIIGSVVAAEFVIERSSCQRISDRLEDVPAARVGVVLGCGRKLANGRLNLYFKHRMEAASELFTSGKVHFLLVSGDNHTKGYNEPAEMKSALVKRGIPETAIFCDYAGFRTLDSIVRASRVFGLKKMVVVSQEFHTQRAVFLARQHGIDAFGYNARGVTGVRSVRTRVREKLARVKALLDCWILGTQPRFLGPRIRIGAITNETDVGENEKG